jgi:hypothetical protein
MFRDVAEKLLSGGFLCEVTAPDSFRWLAEPEHQVEVGRFLERLGRRLASTGNRRAYFVAWQRIGQDERTEIKRTFVTLKHEVNPVTQFIVLSIDASHRDAVPTAGDVVDYPALLKSISDSPHLQEQLRVVAGLRPEFGVSDGTQKGILDRILKQLEKWGYLMLSSKENSTYRFTGKVDYLYEVVDFLMANESDLKDIAEKTEEPETGRLL